VLRSTNRARKVSIAITGTLGTIRPTFHHMTINLKKVLAFFEVEAFKNRDEADLAKACDQKFMGGLVQPLTLVKSRISRSHALQEGAGRMIAEVAEDEFKCRRVEVKKQGLSRFNERCGNRIIRKGRTTRIREKLTKEVGVLCEGLWTSLE